MAFASSKPCPRANASNARARLLGGIESMESDMIQPLMTVADFVDVYKIKMVAERTNGNPNMEFKNADHWRCVLKYGRKRLTVIFSQGYGHKGERPELAAVLSCLAMESQGVDGAGDFEGWCGDFGYHPHERQPKRIYRACKRQRDKLANFLGSAYDALLNDCEPF